MRNADRTQDVGLEASRWLMRLHDQAPPGERQREPDAAFLQWLVVSPRHVQVFLETVQTWRLMGSMDPQRLIHIESLLKNLDADVISMPGAAARPVPAHPPHHSPASAASASSATARRSMFAAAAVLLLAAGAWFGLQDRNTRSYTTEIGEQRTCKLEDGSFIYLNTDSRVQVRFSADQRHVSLVRGEAMFDVERDSRRPFLVEAGDASIRVLGTRFNVRRRSGQTDIAVVEGRVHVATTSNHGPIGAHPERAPASTVPDSNSTLQPVELTAGEQASVAAGRVHRQAPADAATALAWRGRRLVFTDTPLAEVAAEFNRYNRTRIRVEGEDAAGKQLTGIFDADRPQALILYAMKDESLVVLPDGENWVVRSR